MVVGTQKGGWKLNEFLRLLEQKCLREEEEEPLYESTYNCICCITQVNLFYLGERREVRCRCCAICLFYFI